jgi:hypothetical protein
MGGACPEINGKSEHLKACSLWYYGGELYFINE